MPRIKEPKIGTSVMPKYKSPNKKIVESLRNAYDNQRTKGAHKSRQLVNLRGSLRDVGVSRDRWKKQAKEAEKDLANLREENDTLKEELKKNSSGRGKVS
ncbi:MAG: hypothetical protein HN411_03710 [Waddliaceae bacterium]|jgi:hypothetical protein|nr:hypothetical protein [Waddliaceae bacterium]MBT3579100.1 hypothetical protein [Waddliaceae bacterium]MBT4444923.1 hypothetical protein [Waddliaceae bacterium]MBT6928480.1 hypothetical protein [Waddliaceae bacterium]MBT7264514.1 hypothetical protein [Waddliaceae bacterium]